MVSSLTCPYEFGHASAWTQACPKLHYSKLQLLLWDLTWSRLHGHVCSLDLECMEVWVFLCICKLIYPGLGMWWRCFMSRRLGKSTAYIRRLNLKLAYGPASLQIANRVALWHLLHVHLLSGQVSDVSALQTRSKQASVLPARFIKKNYSSTTRVCNALDKIVLWCLGSMSSNKRLHSAHTIMSL